MLEVDARSLKPARLVPPPSKSDAQRALVLGHALGRPPTLSAPLESLPSDVRALTAGLAALGRGGEQTLDCHDGGAPLRFLLGQAAIAAPGRYSFTGTPRLGARPLQPLLTSLQSALPVELVPGNPWPLQVLTRGERAATPRFEIAGAESSQFVSSLLLAAASLHRREGRPWTVALIGPTASEGYLELTVEWLGKAGFGVRREPGALTVEGYTDRGALPPIPGDWSSLGYLLMIAWCSGSAVAGADETAKHPDAEVVPLLRGLGLDVTWNGGEVRVTGKAQRGLSATASTCPDLIPTLAALACVLPEPSRFTEVEILRGKESDRLEGVRALVTAVGGRAEVGSDGALTLTPPAQVPARFEIDSRGDHRLAMSAATLAVLLRTRVGIKDPECVAKSFPGFWTELSAALASPLAAATVG
jgi:3-phosphoshikimate 1-carboxyvinyltransferase